MKTQNIVFIAIVSALAFALATVTEAGPRPDGGPVPAPTPANELPSPDGGPVPAPTPASEQPSPDGGPATAPANERANANSAYLTSPEDVEFPVISIHSTGDVTRGKTGSFVLDMNPAVMFGGTYVNFSVSGTAIPGVDYVVLVSPAYIGQSGYGTILVQTLPDPRASSFRQPYSVVVTLETGAGYAVGKPNSATMWIKP